jgi:5-methylcytosine-specific restriction endonuclease McrA
VTNKLGVDMTDNIKICTGCKLYLPVSNFYVNNNLKSGLASCCKSCQKMRTDVYRANNVDKIRVQSRIRNQRYLANNLEKERERKRLYRLNNPEKNAAKNKKWFQDNPEKVSEYNHARRARLYETGKFVIRYSFLKKLYLSPCVVCSSDKNIELDHVVPVSRGGSHSEGNLQPLCRPCNRRKSNKTMMEWRILEMKRNE